MRQATAPIPRLAYEIGVPDAHHALSQRGGDKVLSERLKNGDSHLTAMFAHCAARLAKNTLMSALAVATIKPGPAEAPTPV